MRVYLLLGLAAVALLLWLTAPEPQPELQEVVVTRVNAEPVRLHDLSPVASVSGRLEPARKAALHFELSGQVAGRFVEPGDRVEPDTLLLTLSDGDFADALAEAEAQLAQERRAIQRDRELLRLAQENVRLQQNELGRLEKLGADSLVSKSHLDEARIQLLKLESEVAQLKNGTATADARIALKEAARNRAARNLERTRLKAPFGGVVNSVEVQSGDYVTPSQTVLQLVDADRLDLYAEVRGEVAGALALGQQVEVAVAGHALTGEVFALQLDPDPGTFTHALRVRLVSGSARPGQVAEAQLPLQRLQQVPAVPATAVLHDEGRTWVFRVENETLHMVEVTLGPRIDNLQVIERGARRGDVVVSNGVAALSDGQRVTTTAVPAATATRAP